MIRAGVFFWNAMKTPVKIFTTWNPIAGRSQIKDGESESCGNNSVAIRSIKKDVCIKLGNEILAWIWI